MASTHEPLPPRDHETAMDYDQHQKTYSLFVTLIRNVTLAIAVLLIILYFLIRP